MEVQECMEGSSIGISVGVDKRGKAWQDGGWVVNGFWHAVGGTEGRRRLEVTDMWATCEAIYEGGCEERGGGMPEAVPCRAAPCRAESHLGVLGGGASKARKRAVRRKMLAVEAAKEAQGAGKKRHIYVIVRVGLNVHAAGVWGSLKMRKMRKMEIEDGRTGENGGAYSTRLHRRTADYKRTGIGLRSTAQAKHCCLGPHLDLSARGAAEEALFGAAASF
ncbi:hypothetical protein BDZ91DRAFT_762716 [Kalaharituber pfeilii]|nr:hypothetical protein BDZ91DRAFT_762716 [Kalaharituber pfeilii]